jgi:ribosomal protein L16 Arg81 hydroxylase
MTSDEHLAALLAPLGPRAFFDEYFGKQPALFRGAPRRARGLISLRRVVRVVASKTEPAGKLLVRREHLTLDAVPSADLVASLGGAVAPGTAPVWAYLEQGHPLVWNGARGATAALDRLTGDLARAFGAQVWANVYATGTAGTPLDMHFDSHEVLAVQCEGVKEWTISKVRVNCPLDLPVLAPAIERALEARREEALAETLMTFTVGPGDVVYVPRGQFHNARTPSGRSLHVTFAISPPTGLDLLEALAGRVISEALFRDYLPVRLADADGCRRRQHLERLIERLLELVRGDEMPALLEKLEAELIGDSPGSCRLESM